MNHTKSKRRRQAPRPKHYANNFLIMPYGKFKGTPVKDIPLDYVRWCLDNVQNLESPYRIAFRRRLGLPDEHRPPISFIKTGSPALDVAKYVNVFRDLARKAHSRMSYTNDHELGDDPVVQATIDEMLHILEEELTAWADGTTG